MRHAILPIIVSCVTGCATARPAVGVTGFHDATVCPENFFDPTAGAGCVYGLESDLESEIDDLLKDNHLEDKIHIAVELRHFRATGSFKRQLTVAFDITSATTGKSLGKFERTYDFEFVYQRGDAIATRAGLRLRGLIRDLAAVIHSSRFGLRAALS